MKSGLPRKPRRSVVKCLWTRGRPETPVRAFVSEISDLTRSDSPAVYLITMISGMFILALRVLSYQLILHLQSLRPSRHLGKVEADFDFL